MTLQLDALYRQDPRGRLLERRAPPDEDRTPPRLFVGITREGLLWRLRADLGAPLVSELSRLLGAEGPPASLDRPPERMASVREHLAGQGAIEREWMGPAFRFPEPLPALRAPSPVEGVVELGPADARRVAHVPALAEQLAWRLPAFAAAAGGEIVSVAYCATPLREPGAGVEVGVDTQPGFRGQGHAARVVAAWAASVRAGGRLPLYSASGSNRASLAVARRLGLVRYGTDLHLV